MHGRVKIKINYLILGSKKRPHILKKKKDSAAKIFQLQVYLNMYGLSTQHERI